VRGSHGSSRDHIGPPIVPSGNDVQTGSPDINGSTVIGEVGLYVGDGRSGDGKRLPNAGGREFARVSVAVSGCYGNGNTAVVKLKVESVVSGVAPTLHPLGTYRHNSAVEGVRDTATQTHGSNRGFAGPPCFLGDPVNPSNAIVW